MEDRGPGGNRRDLVELRKQKRPCGAEVRKVFMPECGL